jgi:hypothetical protein
VAASYPSPDVLLEVAFEALPVDRPILYLLLELL